MGLRASRISLNWGQMAAASKRRSPRSGDGEGCWNTRQIATLGRHSHLLHRAGSEAWCLADPFGGMTCHVEQGFYGHLSRKPTWLYAFNTNLPDLHWGRGEQRIHPVALAKHGYEKARRIGMLAMVGGKRKTEIRNATPPEFRDLLISLARSVET